jgi:hypothetical protein
VLENKLINNGAELIIGYLDESVQEDSDKYGIISKSKHLNDLLILAKCKLSMVFQE